MIIVTGGAGFIGSNVTRALVARGESVIVVDNLTNGDKFKNLVGCRIRDYIDKARFLEMVTTGDSALASVRAVSHQGACSSTTERDGRYMMANNFEYSKAVARFCAARKAQFIYASSAAVYGGGTVYVEDEKYERPLNVYGYSKALFDSYVRHALQPSDSQIVGLRYFNVYGPREDHKGTMASVAFHLRRQALESGRLRLFCGTDGYGDGEQRRDFVYVDDVVSTNLWFLDHPRASGIFNVGTGKAESFNAVASAVRSLFPHAPLEYIPFPDHLRGKYQSFTQADLSSLRAIGCDIPFRGVEAGVRAYMEWLAQNA